MQDTCTDTSFSYLNYISLPTYLPVSLQMDKNWREIIKTWRVAVLRGDD